MKPNDTKCRLLLCEPYERRKCPINDHLIIDLFIDRDEKAILYTSKQYGRKLRQIANRIVDDESVAEECENDTYLRAWNSIPPEEPRDYFFPFLAKITRFIALDRYKEANRQKRSAEFVELTAELHDILPAKDSTSAEAEGRQLRSVINDFLRQINEEKRNVFLRRYWYMDSVSEIANRYHLSEGKVKTILFRVRNELKKYLEKEGYYL